MNQRWYSPHLKEGEHIDKNKFSYTLWRGVKMVSGKPDHHIVQLKLVSSKPKTTSINGRWLVVNQKPPNQVQMVSSQLTKLPHKESKAFSWILSLMNNRRIQRSSLGPFNKLLTLHLIGGISYINDDSQASNFEVLSRSKFNQHLGIPAEQLVSK